MATFALLPLCLGMLQLALLMAENHHVDHAAFQAARYAAMLHGDLGAARRAFAQAATPLFVNASAEVDAGNVGGRVATAYAAALTEQVTYARFRLLSPDDPAQGDFGIPRGAITVIPNDGLNYRSAAPGARSGISIQEANLLRIEVSWCRPLIVPLARQLLLGALRIMDHDPWRQRCYAAGRIAIRSVGASPMQSDFRVSSQS